MKKLLLSCLCILGIATFASADTYTGTLTKQTWSKAGAQTLTDATSGIEAKWTLATDASFFGWDSNNGRGQQVGSSKTAITYINLSTSDIPGTITKVTVNASTASGGSFDLSVKVGDEDFLIDGNTSTSGSTTATDYEFVGEASGEIVISYTNMTTKKGYYFLSVSVEYTEGATSFSVTFDNSTAQWDEVYAYVWTNDPLVKWPGTQLTSDNDLYTYTFEADEAPVHIIFNNGDGNGKQTGDLAFVNGATYNQLGNVANLHTYTVSFDNTNTQWATVCAYYWEGGVANSWPGDEMTQGDNNIWTLSIIGESAPGKIIFNNGGNGQQSANLAFSDGATYSVEQYTYTVSFDTTGTDWEQVNMHVLDLNGNNNSWPGYAMEKDIENPGVYTLTFNLTWVPTTIIFNNGEGGEGNQTDNLQFANNATYNVEGIAEEQPDEPSAETLTDELTLASFGSDISKNSYTDKTATGSETGITYSANLMQSSNGNIQLRSNKDTSGIVANNANGYIRQVIVEWETESTLTGTTIDIYTADSYESAADLYSNATQGTKQGSLTRGSKENTVEIKGNFHAVGIRSNNNALALAKVTFVWGGEASEPEQPEEPEQPAAVNSLAEAKALEAGTSFTYTGELTVVYVNGQYNYVYDGTNFGLIFKNLGLSEGDVIAANWEGTIDNYNGVIELVPTAATLATTGVVGVKPAAVEVYDYNVDEIVTVANQDLYIHLNNVTVASVDRSMSCAIGDATVALYNQWYLAQEPGAYDLYGFVSNYKGAAQVNVATPMDAEAVTGINSIYTSDNAPAEYFNLQGIRVAAPAATGIYLKRQGNKVTKVIVK